MPIAWDDDFSPLVPDTLVPGQLPRRGPTDLEQGWRNLMASILHGACLDLAHPKPTIRCAAAAWFASPDAGRPVSLAMTCEVLGLDARRISRRPALGRPRLTGWCCGPPTSPDCPVKAIRGKVRQENERGRHLGLGQEMRKHARKKPAVVSDELQSEMMTTQEVAQYLHRRYRYNVYWLVLQKALPGLRLGAGGHLRFRRSDVDQWKHGRE